jgi:uncharacterized protein YndB with AHSA1/START domain
MSSEKLEITTPNDRDIVMTRAFRAPRNLVFDAYTKPELLKRWLGAFRGWELAKCEIDLRVGGTLRYEWRGRDNIQMGMSGVYREIVRPERLVNTETFDEAWYEGECVSAVVLTEKDGMTTLVNTSTYDSKEIRDAVANGPMREGVEASFNVLADLLAKMI